ncbi:MAG TPA: hypothetical protein VMZ71_06600, partial [Gemmataceae bacterium]|nr:hypothetical protein [Gemmataceae bacterium]
SPVLTAPEPIRVPPSPVVEAMIPPPAGPLGAGKTFVISRPVGTWTREVADADATHRVTAKFEDDRLTIRFTQTDGKETVETVLDADYSITRDSVVFGVVTGFDTTATAGANAANRDELTDQPFSFRFRVDNGVLTVKDIRMPGVKENSGVAELLLGRFATAAEGAADKLPPAGPAKPKLLPRRGPTPPAIIPSPNIPPTLIPGGSSSPAPTTSFLPSPGLPAN